MTDRNSVALERGSNCVKHAGVLNRKEESIVMNERLRISLRLINMAREIVASDYAHKNDYTDADEEERYADELAQTVYDHCRNHLLESPVVDYVISVSPKRYLKRDAKTDAQRKSYEVRIVLIYKDLVDESDVKCVQARRTYQTNGIGSGEAHCDKGNLVVVAIGASDVDWCCDDEYFIDTITHELMHILDHCAYDYFFNQERSYGKRTVHQKRRNLEVSYPIGEGDDVLDEKYAEYYTCENEMREYRRDLRKEIKRWCETMELGWKDAIGVIRNAMGNEDDFRRFILDWNGNISPLVTLYHLCFSRTSHGNRQTALKLLNGLQEPED